MKFKRHVMTRHTITEDFDNRDVTLSAGDIVILLENDRYGEKGYGGDKYNSGLEKAWVNILPNVPRIIRIFG